MSIVKQVDFFRFPNRGMEMRSSNPNSVGSAGLKRPAGWVVIVATDTSHAAHMYVAINDTGSWQRMDAGTGTLG